MIDSKRIFPIAACLTGAILLGSLQAQAAPAPTTASSSGSPAAATPAAGTSKVDLKKSSKISDYIGLNYFTFWSGPGLGADFAKTPSMSGRRDPDWSLWTNLSIRGKVSKNLALDAQFRLQQFLTNEFQFLYQGVRLGVSGSLLRVERPGYKLNWSGAINTELPGMGQMAGQRQLILNPGMFSSLTFRPTGSRFSLFALVSPRVWFYGDADAMDEVSIKQGLQPGEKPQYLFAVSPSVNYDIGDKTQIRGGLGINLQKNMNSDSFRRWFMPVDVGVSHTFNDMLSIYPNISFSGPWDNELRRSLRAAPGTRWTDTVTLGMWLNGTIL